jgi:hypothetical protein
VSERNVGENEPTVLEDPVTAYRLLDALPAQISRIIKFAPFDYAVAPWAEDYWRLAAAFSDNHIAARFAAEMRRHAADQAARDYGAEHPQAAHG